MRYSRANLHGTSSANQSCLIKLLSSDLIKILAFNIRLDLHTAHNAELSVLMARLKRERLMLQVIFRHEKRELAISIFDSNVPLLKTA